MTELCIFIEIRLQGILSQILAVGALAQGQNCYVMINQFPQYEGKKFGKKSSKLLSKSKITGQEYCERSISLNHPQKGVTKYRKYLS
jgi:hypothetical protein